MRKHISIQAIYYTLLVILLAIVSQLNYLLFHYLSEILAVVIVFAVFMFTWNTRKFMLNGYLLYIGTILVFTGFLDLLHTVTFNGSNVIFLSGDEGNVSCQLWLSSRFIQALSFIVAIYFINKKIEISKLIIVYHFIVFLVIVSVFILRIFPLCYDDNTITSFKRISEIIFSLLFLAALIMFWLNRSEFERDTKLSFLHALVGMFLAELMFAMQIDKHDNFETTGILLKIISYLFIYKAVIVSGLRYPVKILFQDLNQSREKLLENKKQLEVKIKNAVKEIEEKNKMLVLQSRHAQLGEMIVAISHQWKQPLNQISVLATALIDALDYDALNEDYLNKTVDNILSVIKDMNMILNDFRYFYKPQESEITFSIQEVVKPLQNLIGRRLNKYNIDFNVYIEDTIELYGKLNEIIQVLLVIINNSVDAIFINKIGQGKISLNVERIDNTISISVRDNGGGVNPEMTDNLFKPYFTTKGDKGTGMGLFLARIIIEKHFGGKIFARNYRNGLEVSIAIPVN